MKKILSIALIAALVVSSAFAVSFTGSAEIKGSMDFDSKEYGIFNTPTTELKWSWAIDGGEGASAGEKSLYAEIAGKWAVSFNPDENAVTTVTPVNPAISISVDKANIVYDKISVSILGSGKFDGNVKNFKYKVNGADGVNKEHDTVGELAMTGMSGFAVTYDSKFTAGFGIKGDIDAKKNETLVRFDVAEMAIGESVKVKGAAALKAVDGKVDVRGTVKGSYTADPLSVVAAADLKYAEEKFAAEVYGKFGYSPVSVEAYYSTDKILSAKANATFAPITVTAFGYDLTDKNLIAFGGKVAYAENPVEASVEATYQPKTSSLTVALAGKYTAEKFVVDGGVGMVFAFKAEDVFTSLTANLGVSSKAVVDNATVALAWKSGNLLDGKAGSIAASAKVEF